MARIFDGMKQFFDTDDWNYEQVEDRPVLRMGFSGDDGQWMCFAQAREDHDQVLFYSVAQLRVPEERRAAVAEFITRANYGMIVGNFEMDYNDGEVRYKTSADVESLEGSEPVTKLMKQLVYANVLTMDRYLKGLMAVAFGNVEATEGVKMIESPES